ncbi:helix-turn-helix transcriptional regulator [Rahnella sp. ChDrAdgB13]|uniref:XRE family transcriptional regulator n=1 Tax=Rahnella sp. ChDrAdgB13 TaxID=1850581 RepID=UPI001FCBFF7F|nr:helix-turn-helix transcriptional regulator [Rahnella sp. ChDrAdgB13]
MTFSERLEMAMKESGHTQGSLAKAVGMAQSSVWKLVSGGAQGSRKLVDIAKVLGVRPEWLSDGSEPMRAEGVKPYNPDSTIPPESEWGTIDLWDSKTPLSDDEIEVPFYKDIEMAAGAGRCIDTDYNGYKLRFSKATLRRMGVEFANVFCCPAAGDSMEPLIPDGTTIAVDRGTKTIRDGKMYAMGQDGLYRVKVLYALPGRKVRVRSYNEEYPDEEVPLDELDIIGRVFWWSVLDY